MPRPFTLVAGYPFHRGAKFSPLKRRGGRGLLNLAGSIEHVSIDRAPQLPICFKRVLVEPVEQRENLVGGLLLPSTESAASDTVYAALARVCATKALSEIPSWAAAIASFR